MPSYEQCYVRYIVYGADNEYQVAYSTKLGNERAYGYAYDAAKLVSGKLIGVYTEQSSIGLLHHEDTLANFESKVGSSNPVNERTK